MFGGRQVIARVSFGLAIVVSYGLGQASAWAGIRCEALLLERLRNVVPKTVLIHPQLAEVWNSDPARQILVRAEFLPGQAWVGASAAILDGSRAGEIKGEPHSLILKMDGWSVAAMFRSLREIVPVDKNTYDWLNFVEKAVPPASFALRLAMSYSQLEQIRSEQEIIVVTLPLRHAAHDLFGVVRERVFAFGALVGRRSAYSEPGHEHLLIALPADNALAAELLGRLAMLPALRDHVGMTLMQRSHFWKLIHQGGERDGFEPTSFVGKKGAVEASARDADSVVESSDQYRPIEMQSSTRTAGPLGPEEHASSIRFSLIELE